MARILITFIVNYFSEKDSTMDVDFNMGVVSFVPAHSLPVRADVFILILLLKVK
jgi:hypothetical protein